VGSTTARVTTSWSCLLIGLLLAAPGVTAQPVEPIIRGRVVAEENDRPLRRALVEVTAGEGRIRPVLTDDQGRFEIRPPDASTPLAVSKAGYATAKLTPPRRSTNTAPEFVVRLPRGGVISGRIIDSNGETAIGMKLTARLEGTAGETRTFDGEADDLGEYRISGLPAGRYVISQAATTTRVLTTMEYSRLEELLKQGRRFQDVLLEPPKGPSRPVDVRSGEETSSIDLEVSALHTIRSLLPMMNPAQFAAPPGQVPGSTISRSNSPASIVIGPPQAQLGGGRVLNVFGNEGPRSLDLTLSGGAAISGIIVDNAGEPFQGITVRALHVRHENGRTVARAVAWPRVTDDRGRYRLFGLAPGSYLIVASLDATEFTSGRSSTTGFVPLYFPGTAQLDAAQMVRVEIGSDLSGSDLTFAATPVLRLTGKALDFMGHPLVGRISLSVSQRSSPITTDPRVVRTGPEGSFEFINVTPGDYVVQATAEAGFGGPAEFGTEYVTVADRDPPPLVVPTSRGVTLEGRFVVDGPDEAPMRAYSVRAAPQDLDRSPAGSRGPAIHDDGRFYITGLHGPMRLTSPNTLPGWYVKSVTIGGVDITDMPFDFGHDDTTVTDAQIVISNSGAAIAGSIEIDNQRATRMPTSTVIAFSTSRDNWFDGSRHVKRTSSAPSGSFDIVGLPPGEYFVAAVDASTSLDLQAPTTLESLVPRAVRVSAREGTVSTVTLSPPRR
jgi:hypothetical protein